MSLILAGMVIWRRAMTVSIWHNCAIQIIGEVSLIQLFQMIVCASRNCLDAGLPCI